MVPLLYTSGTTGAPKGCMATHRNFYHVGRSLTLELQMDADVAETLAVGNNEILASCGRSFVDMESIVVDENDRPTSPGVVGKLKVRGLGNCSGYWRKDAETAAVFRNGWYYPLDLCRVDERGFIYVVDRKKDMIITGGENVYPAEVENVLYRHPQVSQAAVIALPDAKWGEAVTAVVQLKPGENVYENELRSFCKAEIASYKSPRRILFIDEMPRSASGKILKYKLREQYKA